MSTVRGYFSVNSQFFYFKKLYVIFKYAEQLRVNGTVMTIWNAKNILIWIINSKLTLEIKKKF